MSNALDLSEATLSSALDAGEFVLYYQPDFDPKTEEITGLEALLRWNHSTQGLCDAGRFIAGFERSKQLISRVDQWVLNAAMKQGRVFLDDAKVIKTISVNLSTWLSGDELIASVEDALNVTGFPAKSLSLECPWRMFVAHSAEILPVMHKLHALGCTLVVDGSPLEQDSIDILKGVPVDISKICYAALHGKVEEEGIRMASSLVKELRRMKVKIVVVGVENEEHVELVKKAGCSLSQGNRFKSPLSPDNVLKLLSVIRKTKDAFKLL